ASLSSRLPFARPSRHPDLHSFPTRRSSDLGKVEGAADRQGVGAIELYKVFLLEQIIGGKLGVFDQQFSKFGFQLGSVPALFLERSEEHTSELQSRENLVCRLLLEKKKYVTH